MKASGSKPPGTSAFSLEPVVNELEDSDDFVEILDDLPVGAMAFGDLDPVQYMPSNKWMELSAPVVLGPLDEWRQSYPRWKEPGVWARRRIGDFYALVADSILTHSQPFPGDEDFKDDDLRPELRFRVFKSTNSPEYVIHDHLILDSATIPASLVKKPHFNIGRWYARQRSQSRIKDKSILQHATMGNALITVATKLLADGIRSYYPSRNGDLDPVRRFTMYPPNQMRRGYMVSDRDLGYLEEITPDILRSLPLIS
jgi:hypothetical protein